MRFSVRKNSLQWFLAFTLMLIYASTAANTHTTADTSYYDYISFRGISYDIKVVQKSEFYEISFRGPRIHAHIDSAAKPIRIVVDSFDATVTESGTRQLPFDFTEQLYSSRLLILLVSQITSTASNDHLLTLLNSDPQLPQDLRLSYLRVKNQFQAKVQNDRVDSVKQAKAEEVRVINQAHKHTIDSLLGIIDIVDEENKYGGQFEFADKDSLGVTVYTAGRKKLDTQKVKFYPQNIVIRTFNNFIDLIHVDGFIKDSTGKQIPVRCYNGDYSIALKSIYMRNQFLVFTIQDRLHQKEPSRNTADTNLSQRKQEKRSKDSAEQSSIQWRYLVNVSDLIRVNAYRNHFTFMIKDDSYVVSRHKDSLVEPYFRKSIYDYLTVTTFLDFLGVMEKTPNSLIQIEGKVRLPLRLMNSLNFKRANNVWLPKLDAYLNAAFVNGSQPDNRFGAIFNGAATPNSSDSLYIDQFDLVRKYNISTGIELGVFKKEIKSMNINMYFDYALRFWRTGLRYTIVDTTALDQEDQFNAWSWAHGPVLRFEYRPDLNIGADLSCGFDFNQRILNSDNDNLAVRAIRGPLNKNISSPGSFSSILKPREKTNYKLELNVYYMVNPRRSNGGLYFRLSNYFSYNFKQNFPQVLVGYSTRLSGMINNISQKSTAK